MQNPHCEGDEKHKQRKLFNSRVHHPGQPPHGISLRSASPGEYVIHSAGDITGNVPLESEFAVFRSNDDIAKNPPLFHVRVSKIQNTTCLATLRDKLEVVPALPDNGAIAVQVKTGQALGRLRVRIADSSPHRRAVLEAAADVQDITCGQRWSVFVTADGPAELGIVPGGDLVFEILDAQICELGLPRRPFTVPAGKEQIEYVLRTAAHFFYHLRRKPKYHKLRDKVAMRVHSLVETSEREREQEQEHLLKPQEKDVVDVITGLDDPPVWEVPADGGETHYGIELESRADVGFFPSMLFFDCSNFEISRCRYCRRACAHSNRRHRASVRNANSSARCKSDGASSGTREPATQLRPRRRRDTLFRG
jgi:hypothetical protein